MTAAEVRAEADQAAADFARTVAQSDSGTTGIPKPPEVIVSQVETDTERFGLDFEPQSTVVQGGDGGGGIGPPPEGHTYRITVHDANISGTCSQFDCISFGGTATWNKSQPGVIDQFDVSDDPNNNGGCESCDWDTNCSFFFEARVADLTPNPCVGLSNACDWLGGDWAQFWAGMDVGICSTGIFLQDSYVDADLESGGTLCFGDCDNGCGYVTCWIVGDTYDEPMTKYVNWSNWGAAVGSHPVTIHLSQHDDEDTYCGGCGDPSNNECWPDPAPLGDHFTSETTLSFTVTVAQTA
jgi:hypothetical protein